MRVLARQKRVHQRAGGDDVLVRRILARAGADEQNIFKIFLPEKFRRRAQVQKRRRQNCFCADAGAQRARTVRRRGDDGFAAHFFRRVFARRIA
jgi:hypothetical protein